MKLTDKQITLLNNLYTNGGSIQGRNLDRGKRALASKMQSMKLVIWRSPPPMALRKRKPNLDDWRLEITDKGRAAIGKG